MHIIAFDPGETIGVAQLWTNDALPLEDWWPPNTANSNTTEASWTDLELLCDWGFLWKRNPFDAVIIETFRLFPHLARQQIGSEFPAVQVIGMLKLLAHQSGLTHCLHFQQPEIQKLWTDTKLKQLGFQLYGTSPHERSALKHAVHYLRTVTNQQSPRTLTKKKR